VTDDLPRVTFVEPVRTRRLVLRPLAASDVTALVAYRSIPEVCRWVPFAPMDATEVRSRLRTQWSKLTLGDDDDAVTLGVEIEATGALIGDVMLHYSSFAHSSAEIGYVFHPDYAGHGYATEAAHELLHVAFDQLCVHRVTARLDARNTASAGVVTRLGMRLEAHLVQNEWFKGEWTDELDFALLRHEWHRRSKTNCP
jgi:RimJ/RimL family protein N-acetyltransferase